MSEDESEEDNFEDGLDFQNQEVEEDIAGIRRRLSDEATVNRVGEALNQTLGADRDESADPREHFSPVQVRFPVNAPALRPPQPSTMVNYDQENGADAAGSMQAAIVNLKGYVWNPSNLKFYFNQVEIKMKLSGVKKQFTKLQVLTTILPDEVMQEVKDILEMQESDFEENDAYYKLKTELIEIFGPPKEDAFERAMSRVLSGKPSQLARALVSDLCDHKLDGCCCYKFIYGLWRRQLPSNVKAGIAHLDFNAMTFKQVIKLADDIHGSNRPPGAGAQVAAVESELLETGFHQSFPSAQGATASEVAAVQFRGRGRGRGQRGGRGGRGGRGSGRGGNQNSGQNQNSAQNQKSGEWSASNPRWSGPRHPDLPPFNTCKKHWDWGKSARFCQEPWSCPWKKFYSQPGNQ